MIKRYDNHIHTHKSNIINRDSTNFESTVIDRALELNLGGISITDHANLSAHVDALLYLKKLRKEAQEAVDKDPCDILALNNKKKLEDFKLGLGTEIYLVDREVIENARENNEPTKFYHLVLVAKNYKGYRALAELSSQSWEDSFHFRGMQRVPTYKDYFIEWAKRNKGNIICSSACIGSEFSQLVLKYIEEPTISNKDDIINFLGMMNDLFGEDFYIELQPSHFEEQIAYNKLALEIAQAYRMKAIITTDAHYESLEMKEIHSIYLKSQDAERETEQFYASCYMMDNEELRSYFPYLDDETFESLLSNTTTIGEKIEEYDLYKDIEVPKTKIKYLNVFNPLFRTINIAGLEYLQNFLDSEHEIDRILVQQLELGIREKKIDLGERELLRINTELRTLWLVSEKLHQRLSSYYLLTKEIIELMWRVSLVGVSRGSAGAFYLCYLLGITQINPLDYDLPDWRHLSEERPELPDIDIDTEKGQRSAIMEIVKEVFGYDKVLNIATFKTEGTASAIQTMCRGMGISIEDSTYISSLVVEGMSVKECMQEYKNNKDCKMLIDEMLRFEGLIENVIAIEGLVCGRSVHASGVYIYNTPYHEHNAMMKTPKGIEVTQYDMKNSDYQGGLKLDFLTIESLDRIRKAMELLIEDGIIEDKGSLKATYDAYLHPDKIIKNDKDMWETLCKGEVLDAFQYDSVQGRSTINKIHPHSFQEIMDGNALMRLSCEGEQPIDRYVRHKNNIDLWYREMYRAGLDRDEIEVMKKHLLKSYGVAPTQEAVMRLSMDKKIAGFDLVWANKLRKAIAKAKAKHMIEEVKQKFMSQGMELGNRKNILEYVWKTCVEPMLGYGFSEPHLAGYSLILVQEMNIAHFLSPLHWSVSCLCVNAGDINENVSKGTDYGAIAKAIGNMKKGFVTPPYINKAGVGFKPNMETNSCSFGLGAINGISNELAKEIIAQRPFNSVQDFFKKCIDTKIVQPSKMYSLIKAGAFDEFNQDRVAVMVQFINYIVPDKTKLTTSNVAKMLEYRIVPDTMIPYIQLMDFKKFVFNKKNCVKMYNKTQGLYRVTDVAIKYFEDNLQKIMMDAVEYDDNGHLCLKSKEFDKTYKNCIAPLTEWLASEEALNLFNYSRKNELWMKYCTGTLSKWEMDSISFYCRYDHELKGLQLDRYYTVSNFNELSDEPETYMHTVARTGRTQKRNKLSVIAGTVVEKNKNKSIITLNTEHGVVEVKMQKQTFTKFDRKTPEEASWFTRGNKLMVVGFRRGELFIPRTYADDIFASSIMKLDCNMETGNVEIATERIIDMIDEYYVA